MHPKKTIGLCEACGACPTIELYDDSVRIGEEGNRVALTKVQWNDLVEKITRGELSRI